MKYSPAGSTVYQNRHITAKTARHKCALTKRDQYAINSIAKHHESQKIDVKQQNILIQTQECTLRV